MKHLISIILIFCLVYQSGQSATLSDMTDALRGRISEVDSVTSSFTNTQARRWINEAQDKVVTLGGLLAKSTDITFAVSDTLGSALPVDFRQAEGAMILVGTQWQPMLINPLFIADTSVPQYYIGWQDADTARFYSKQIAMVGARMRLFYRGVAASLDSVTAVVEVQENLHVFIIEEALSYYLQSLKMFGDARAIQAQVRADMGVGKQ